MLALMRKSVFLSLVACLLAGSFAHADPAPGPMKLFLLIGQSNMAGRGKVEPQDQVVNPKIFMLTKDLKWEPAKDPLHFDKPVAGVGPGSEFAREILKQDPKTPIGLIPCAVGGTSLDQWKAGGPLYDAAVLRAKEAMKQGKLAGILWHQGEADSAPDKVASYADRFSTLITQLRQDLGDDKLPVVVGELGRFRAESKAFNDNLPTVVAKVPHCGLVTSEGLTDKGDKLHFDSASARQLGERYAAAFLKLSKP
jgi:hypothetical protein